MQRRKQVPLNFPNSLIQQKEGVSRKVGGLLQLKTANHIVFDIAQNSAGRKKIFVPVHNVVLNFLVFCQKKTIKVEMAISRNNII